MIQKNNNKQASIWAATGLFSMFLCGLIIF